MSADLFSEITLESRKHGLKFTNNKRQQEKSMRNLKALLLNRTKKPGDERILFPTPSADTAPSLVLVTV